MKKLMIVALTVALVAPFAMAKTETFDSAASAAANGWVDQVPANWLQEGGWAGTNLAGGAAAGEGWIDSYNRNGFQYYADTTLSLSGSSAMSASGKMSYDTEGWGGSQWFTGPAFMLTNGGAANLGYGDISAVGFLYWADHWSMFAMYQGAWGPVAAQEWVTSSGVVDFSLAYDPITDELTGTLDDGFFPVNWTLDMAGFLDGKVFDSFGIADTSWFDGGNHLKVTIDDVTYVPEPATMSLLALGGLVAIRRRK